MIGGLLRWLGVFLIFCLLTILTQVGGLVLLLTLLICQLVGKEKWWQKTLFFGLIYVVTTFVVVPPVAGLFGREKIQHREGVRPANLLTDLLNRNYVVPALNELLRSSEESLSELGIRLQYLDASFPFIDGFPLLPHLSHNDGRKVDLSYVYASASGEITARVPSWTGYGIFIEPATGEVDQTGACLAKGYWQYDFTKWFGWSFWKDTVKPANRENKQLLEVLLRQSATQKIFIEPHLKTRWGINHAKLRFHGCQAVRHDDHLHLQIK